MQFAGTALLSGACSFVYGNKAVSFNENSRRRETDTRIQERFGVNKDFLKSYKQAPQSEPGCGA